MSDCDQFELCQKQLASIQSKLDRLDEAIRGAPGNGSRPGILVRLDRLEQDAIRQSKLIWLIIGSVVTAVTSVIVIWLTVGGAI
ncbi:hypothetical protein KS4_10860 [Poriferisphaera corsica]|uniref:Uncharacterized protein n=1 Tax=Poriferisphaera corsica TaxID=2528020 RepID=A0A517YS45_9BACT|nr:hypothetical protein [Poriferisphaera corsica]QDU33045.1 hypothetical protein KS4_10860 [Poriferisphaera corsica]